MNRSDYNSGYRKPLKFDAASCLYWTLKDVERPLKSGRYLNLYLISYNEQGSFCKDVAGGDEFEIPIETFLDLYKGVRG